MGSDQTYQIDYLEKFHLTPLILGISHDRCNLYHVVEDIWQTIQAGHAPSPIQAAQFQSMNVQVFGMCLDAVQLLFKARGGSSVYSGSVLETCLRDMQTMDQHVMSSMRAYAQSGRILLGLPPEEILL